MPLYQIDAIETLTQRVYYTCDAESVEHARAIFNGEMMGEAHFGGTLKTISGGTEKVEQVVEIPAPVVAKPADPEDLEAVIDGLSDDLVEAVMRGEYDEITVFVRSVMPNSMTQTDLLTNYSAYLAPDDDEEEE